MDGDNANKGYTIEQLRNMATTGACEIKTSETEICPKPSETATIDPRIFAGGGSRILNFNVRNKNPESLYFMLGQQGARPGLSQLYQRSNLKPVGVDFPDFFVEWVGNGPGVNAVGPDSQASARGLQSFLQIAGQAGIIDSFCIQRVNIADVIAGASLQTESTSPFNRRCDGDIMPPLCTACPNTNGNIVTVCYDFKALPFDANDAIALLIPGVGAAAPDTAVTYQIAIGLAAYAGGHVYTGKKTGC